MRFSNALALLLLGFALGACATTRPAPPAPVPSSPDQKFAQFLVDFRPTALAAGVVPETWDSAMAHLSRNPRVEELNLKQPEFSVPVWRYLDGMVSDARVASGRAELVRNGAALHAIETRYGVPASILVAIWGAESDFGSEMGSFNIFEALATLAYDGPRADYGRRELIDALLVMQQQHYPPASMLSSWAGAFGQVQFVPSAFLAHAVDGDGDGAIDLWNSTDDALASAAHFLADQGWQRGAPWGYEISLPPGFDYTLGDPEIRKTVADWAALGIKAANGASLPAATDIASIFVPAGAHGPAFLVFANFAVVLKYNNATSYALGVCTLADRLEGRVPIAASWPRDERSLTRDERMAVQSALSLLGYDPGPVDGMLGNGTQRALRAWQKAEGLAADGFATAEIMARLLHEAKVRAPSS